MKIDFPIDKNQALGLIPARGGSKSIPMKNITLLNGLPLINYVIASAKKSKHISLIYCSTDHKSIKEACTKKAIHVIDRPSELGQDDTNVVDVIKHSLNYIAKQKGSYPKIVALLQPTSPFILPTHIDKSIELLNANQHADSVQSITPVIHNSHAYNQRIITDNKIVFRFAKERSEAYNKQRKPSHYIFGNLVVFKTTSLFNNNNCFGKISLPIYITRDYAIDIDTPEDIDYADFLLENKKVLL